MFYLISCLIMLMASPQLLAKETTWLNSEEITWAVKKRGQSTRSTQEWTNLADVSLYCLPKPVVSLTPINLPHHDDAVERKKITNDFIKIKSLAWCYTLSKKSIFLTKAGFYLHEWMAHFNLIHQPIYAKDVYSIIDLIQGYSLIGCYLPLKLQKNTLQWLLEIGFDLTQYDPKTIDETSQLATLKTAIGFATQNVDLINEGHSLYIDVLNSFTKQKQIWDIGEKMIWITNLLEISIMYSRNHLNLISMENNEGLTLYDAVQEIIPYVEGKIDRQFPGNDKSQQLLSRAAFFWPIMGQIKINGQRWQSADCYVNTLNNSH
ncbi:MAG: hypothetical protein JHC93_00035 [Parachlamydiales bacterium]|nr:hypothetical protein [Parachlamydiales bacterium]